MNLSEQKIIGKRALDEWRILSGGLPIGTTSVDVVALSLTPLVQQFYELAHKHTRDESILLTPYAGGKWAEYGNPVFELSASLASAFVLTDCSGVSESDFKLPFSSFVIQPPRSLLTLVDPRTREQVSVSSIQVCAFDAPTESNPFLQMLTQTTLRPFFGNAPKMKESLEVLRGAVFRKRKLFLNLLTERSVNVWHTSFYPFEKMGVNDDPEPSMEFQAADSAALVAAGRIVVNLCAFINTRRTDADGAHPMPKEFMRDRKGAKHWVLGKAVKLPRPLHEAARQFAETGKRTAWQATSRWVVRGHWRNQPYGPGSSERKLIWVEPHWKGPADAVAAVSRKYEVEQVR